MLEHAAHYGLTTTEVDDEKERRILSVAHNIRDGLATTTPHYVDQSLHDHFSKASHSTRRLQSDTDFQTAGIGLVAGGISRLAKITIEDRLLGVVPLLSLARDEWVIQKAYKNKASPIAELYRRNVQPRPTLSSIQHAINDEWSHGSKGKAVLTAMGAPLTWWGGIVRTPRRWITEKFTQVPISQRTDDFITRVAAGENHAHALGEVYLDPAHPEHLQEEPSKFYAQIYEELVAEWRNHYHLGLGHRLGGGDDYKRQVDFQKAMVYARAASQIEAKLLLKQSRKEGTRDDLKEFFKTNFEEAMAHIDEVVKGDPNNEENIAYNNKVKALQGLNAVITTGEFFASAALARGAVEVFNYWFGDKTESWEWMREQEQRVRNRFQVHQNTQPAPPAEPVTVHPQQGTERQPIVPHVVDIPDTSLDAIAQERALLGGFTSHELSQPGQLMMGDTRVNTIPLFDHMHGIRHTPLEVVTAQLQNDVNYWHHEWFGVTVGKTPEGRFWGMHSGYTEDNLPQQMEKVREYFDGDANAYVATRSGDEIRQMIAANPLKGHRFVVGQNEFEIERVEYIENVEEYKKLHPKFWLEGKGDRFGFCGWGHLGQGEFKNIRTVAQLEALEKTNPALYRKFYAGSNLYIIHTKQIAGPLMENPLSNSSIAMAPTR